jgi:hypothetical protein
MKYKDKEYGNKECREKNYRNYCIRIGTKGTISTGKRITRTSIIGQGIQEQGIQGQGRQGR